MAFAKDIEKKLRKKRRSKTADFSQLMTKNHHGNDFEINKTEGLQPNQIEEELLGTSMNREQKSKRYEDDQLRMRDIETLKSGCQTTKSVTQKRQRNSLPMFDLNDDAANESF